MKQFVKDKITLLQGDCLELMKDIPDGSIDMILADLPYGITACKWDTIIPFEPLWEQYKRVIKDNGAIVLFGSEPFSSLLRCSNLKIYKYDWIWEKDRPSNSVLAKKQPIRMHETISVFYKIQCLYFPVRENKNRESIARSKRKYTDSSVQSEHFNHKGIITKTLDCYPRSIQFFKKESNNQFKKQVFHPTQKPVALMEYLIKTYTNEGETVLDNVMGSGTTGIACINLKRNFIGMELNDKYFAIAEKRIKEHQRQLTIF